MTKNSKNNKEKSLKFKVLSLTFQMFKTVLRKLFKTRPYFENVINKCFKKFVNIFYEKLIR